MREEGSDESEAQLPPATQDATDDEFRTPLVDEASCPPPPEEPSPYDEPVVTENVPVVHQNASLATVSEFGDDDALTFNDTDAPGGMVAEVPYSVPLTSIVQPTEDQVTDTFVPETVTGFETTSEFGTAQITGTNVTGSAEESAHSRGTKTENPGVTNSHVRDFTTQSATNEKLA